MTEKKHKVYVYGTLRKGNPDTVLVPGTLYNLGWYPGIKLHNDYDNGPFVVCEVREVTDSELTDFDRYEGYYPDDPKHSLYIRRHHLDGWIYEYNRDVDPEQLIETGDWNNKHPHHNTEEETLCN